MTPATAELQRRSFEIAMDATRKALAKPRLEPWQEALQIVHDSRSDFDREMAAESEAMDREANFATGFQTESREDDEPFSCLTCEDTGYIEVPQRKLGAFGEVARTEPWATETVPCPDCNAGGAR